MCIKKVFNILLFFIFILLYAGCMDKERLNPVDPLSPDYKEPTWVTNVIFNYENSTIINEDTTWNVSPIKIIQNVLITDGATLTIKEGTKVEFYAIGSGSVGIIVENLGKLNAEGTKTKPICFDAIDGAISYIVFREGSGNSVFKYCKLTESFFYCINVVDSIPVIQYNKIMALELFSSSPLMNRMEIMYNQIDTMLCNSSHPIIKYNNFFDLSFDNAIEIKGNSETVIRSNNIEGGANYRIKNDSILPQSAENNYWGSGLTTPTNIEAWIYDDTDNPTNGQILFMPFYTNEISWIGPQVSW